MQCKVFLLKDFILSWTFISFVNLIVNHFLTPAHQYCHHLNHQQKDPPNPSM